MFIAPSFPCHFTPQFNLFQLFELFLLILFLNNIHELLFLGSSILVINTFLPLYVSGGFYPAYINHFFQVSLILPIKSYNNFALIHIQCIHQLQLSKYSMSSQVEYYRYTLYFERNKTASFFNFLTFF